METLTDSGAVSDGGSSLVVVMETVLRDEKRDRPGWQRCAGVINLR